MDLGGLSLGLRFRIDHKYDLKIFFDTIPQCHIYYLYGLVWDIGHFVVVALSLLRHSYCFPC